MIVFFRYYPFLAEICYGYSIYLRVDLLFHVLFGIKLILLVTVVLKIKD